MKDTSEDWLSRTMRMVEAVMERHGFEDDGVQEVEPAVKPTTKPAANPAANPTASSTTDGNLSGWTRLLRRATFLSPL